MALGQEGHDGGVDGRVGREGCAESSTIAAFSVSVVMLYVECHRYDLVPDIEEWRAICKGGNESENSE